MKTIIIGLGNPILSDDGVGWKVVDELQSEFPSPPSPLPAGEGRRRRGEGEIVCETASLGGLSLMERMIGFERAILIDALETSQSPAGSVRVFPLEALPNPSAGHSASAHDASLLTALATGRSMGLPLPDEVFVVAIEAKQVYDFSEELSPAVAAAVPVAAQAVFEILDSKCKSNNWRHCEEERSDDEAIPMQREIAHLHLHAGASVGLTPSQ